MNKKGCEPQTHRYRKKAIRPASISFQAIGHFVSFVSTGVIPIPIDLLIDGITGANWKPDETEIGIHKINFDHFDYIIEYKGCKTEESPIVKANEPLSIEDKIKKIKELKKLLDSGAITQQEYNKMKHEIFDE